jgi:hypothetical protein
MSAEQEAPKIDPETVAELLSTVRGLQQDESERASSLNTRASGLTGFVGLILSIAAAAVAATGKGAGAGLHHDVRVLTGTLVVGALFVLALTIVVVVAKVLVPTPGWSLGMSEVRQYPNWEFITQDRVMIQGHGMRGLVDALERDRERNAMKAKWLARSYWLVCLGLALVASAGIISTLDRYVI